MSEQVLRTNALTKKYGQQAAVNNVSMSLHRGDIYGFIGRNGAGKTTMMKMMIGMALPSGGDIELFGCTDAKSIQKARRRIGSIIESPAIYPHLTAAENMQCIRKLRGCVEDESAALLKLCGIADTEKKKASKFSMGMKQRLGLAMTLIGHPDLLLLDEPVNGLDPQGTADMRNLLLRLNREQGITILVSSHMLDELSRIATCYGIIDQGRLTEQISAKALAEKCTSYTKLCVDDAEKASALIETELGVRNYRVMEGGTAIHILEPVLDMAALNACLVHGGVGVRSLSTVGQSLEYYFMSRTGGAAHA